MKKLLPFVGVIAILVVGFFVYLNREVKETKSYSVADNYSTSISLQSGVINVVPASGGLQSQVKYSGKKPSISFDNNDYILTSEKVKELSISLPKNVNSSNLTINATAGNINLSLVEIPVNKVTVNATAGYLTISLPGDVTSEIQLNVAAGNVNLQIPKNKKLGGVKIIPENGTSLSLPGEGWKKVGESYETANYSKATIKSNIKLSAGSINLNITTID